MEPLSTLTPTQFENLVYDLLQASGMNSLVWRTPGADGGRDIEGTFPAVDFSGSRQLQKWYVECKLYSSSLDWPTVWKKISYAESRGADFLLIVTNSNPSPQCESEITNWNAQNARVVVRAWRGYEIGHILSNYPLVAAKHGLLTTAVGPQLGVQSLTFEIMKSAQTSYAAYRLGMEIEKPLEANAALSELISMRLDQIATYGRFVTSGACAAPPEFAWLTWTGTFSCWEEAGLRALLCMLRYVTYAETLEVEGQTGTAQLNCRGARCALRPSTLKIVRDVALWANIELRRIENSFVELAQRQPHDFENLK
jgi:hypothetical protein